MKNILSKAKTGGISTFTAVKDYNIQTERLFISPLTATDIDAMHELHCHEAVAKYNTIGIPKDRQQTLQLLSPVLESMGRRNPTQIAWTIREAMSGEFVGELGIRLAATRFQMGEIYYNLIPTKWGKGYGIESCKALLQFAFNILDLHRIEAGVAVENTRSIRLLEHLGMTQEGRKRKILPLRTGWSDNFMYAILKEEFIPV